MCNALISERFGIPNGRPADDRPADKQHPRARLDISHPPHPRSTKVLVYLGLGANQGDPPTTFASALDTLEPALAPLTISSLYRSAPVVRRGGYAEPQAPYTNLVVRGFASRHEYPAEKLLRWTQEIEEAAGRLPHGPLDAPRPLDIDLLLYGDQVLAGQELTVPHPRMHLRRFVLAPLQELAPDLKIPVIGLSVSELLAALSLEEDWVERISTPEPLGRWRD